MTHPETTTPANPAQGVNCLRTRIYKALCDYSMSNFVFDDDDHVPYSLKDLCTPDGEGIDKGEEELFLLADEIAAAVGAGGQADTFQQRVQPWMMACFGPEISSDKLERADRFIEEVLELVQSGDYPRERIAALTEYVYSRPKGEPSQEVGGVTVTLAAYCLAHGLDMHEAAETELARIWTKVEKIRAKQAAKPTGSALPVAHPAPSGQAVKALQELLAKLDKCPRTDRGFHWQASDWHQRENLNAYGEWASALYWIIENQDVLVFALSNQPAQPGWREMSSAPKDGTEFLAALSNGWIEILSGNDSIRDDWRYSWWTARGRSSIPYEPSHPADTDWSETSTLRAVGWMPLPASPLSGDAR